MRTCYEGVVFRDERTGAPQIRNVQDLQDYDHSPLKKGMNGRHMRQLSQGTKLYRLAEAHRAWKFFDADKNTTIFSGKKRDPKKYSNGVKSDYQDPEASSWWMGQKSFQTVLHEFIQKPGPSKHLGDALAHGAAVLPSWNEDRGIIVEAVLLRPVMIFFGPGKPQKENYKGELVEMPGSPTVEQWYIPCITRQYNPSPDVQATVLSDLGKSIIKVIRLQYTRKF